MASDESSDPAHQKAVIHRDLKPSNILVDGEGNLKILDFGLARAISRTAETVTITGQVMGTLPYMSPEQTKGNPDLIDTRTDVYALGVILYEMLTGTYPYPVVGEMADVLKHISETAPKPLTKSWTKESGIGQSTRTRSRSKCPIDNEVETIALKALAKEKERRYQSAADLGEDVRHYLANEPVEAKRDSGWYVLRKALRRYRVPAAVAVVFAATMVAFSIAMTLALNRATEAEKSANSQRLNALVAQGVAESSAREANAARNDLQATLSDTQTELGWVAARSSQPREALLRFALALASAKGEPERDTAARLRLEYWSHEMPLSVAAFVATQRTHDDVTHLAFDATGRYLLVQTRAGGCAVWNWRIGRIAQWFPRDVPVHCGDWKPDGAVLAIAVKDEVWILDTSDGHLISRIPVPNTATTIKFNRDGTNLAIAGAGMQLWDTGPNGSLRELMSADRNVWALVFSNDNRYLAAASTRGNDDSKVSLFSLHDNQVRLQFEAIHRRRLARLTDWFLCDEPPVFVSIGGRQALATAHTDGQQSQIRMLDLDTGDLLGTLPWYTEACSLTASADGQYLLIGRFPTGHLHSLASREPAAVLHHTNWVCDASFSLDGTRLATASVDGSVGRWAIEHTPRSPQLLQRIALEGDVYRVAWSHDGALLASAQEGGLVQVWGDPDALSLRHRIPTYSPLSHPKISTCGRYVLACSHRYDAGSEGVTLPRVYDLLKSGPAGPQLGSAVDIVDDAAFLPNGKHVVILSRGCIQLWDWRSGSPVSKALRPRSYARRVVVRQDGMQLAVICDSGETIVISGDGASVLHTMSHLAMTGVNAIDQIRPRVSFSPDGRMIAACAEQRPYVCVWDSQTFRLRYPPIALASGCFGMAFSTNSELLCTAEFANQVQVFRTSDGQEASRPLVHPNWVFTSCFSEDGNRILTACRDGRARVWDWHNGVVVGRVLRHEDEIFAATFIGDDKFALTAGRDARAILWDLASGRPIMPDIVMDGAAGEICVSPMGDRAVVGCDGFSMVAMDLPRIVKTRDWSEKDFILWAEVLSRCRVMDGGGLSNMSAAEWLDRRKLLDKRQPNWVDTGLSPVRASQQLRLDDKNYVSNALRRETDGLANKPVTRPVTPAAGSRRIQDQADFFKTAAAARENAVALDPANHWTRFQYACLLAQLGDAAAYRDCCNTMLKQFGDTGDRAVAERVAKASLFMSEEGIDVPTACKLADRAVNGPDHQWMAYFQLTKGLAEYRRGRIEEAAEWAGKSATATRGSQVVHAFIESSLLLSMAQHRLGQVAEARNSLQEAIEAMKCIPQPGQEDFEPAFHDWIICQALRREAEALINGPATRPVTQPTR